MKFQFLAAMAALAVATVSAAECTEEQLDIDDAIDDTPYKKACRPLFLNSAPYRGDISTFTNESLKVIEPCKEKACLDEGKKLADATPDCTFMGFNIKEATTITMKLCEAFNAGPVSVETAQSMFKDIAEAHRKVWGSSMDDDGSEEDSGVPTLGSDSTTKPGNAAEVETPATTTPGAPPTTTPAPTIKSDASSVDVVAGIALSALAMTLTL